MRGRLPLRRIEVRQGLEEAVEEETASHPVARSHRRAENGRGREGTGLVHRRDLDPAAARSRGGLKRAGRQVFGIELRKVEGPDDRGFRFGHGRQRRALGLRAEAPGDGLARRGSLISRACGFSAASTFCSQEASSGPRTPDRPQTTSRSAARVRPT